jgi:hypothetical protein
VHPRRLIAAIILGRVVGFARVARPAHRPPAFGLQDATWSEDDWYRLLHELTDSGFFSWEDIATLALGQANPPQVGTSIASSPAAAVSWRSRAACARQGFDAADKHRRVVRRSAGDSRPSQWVDGIRERGFSARALRCDVALVEVMAGLESMCEHSRGTGACGPRLTRSRQTMPRACPEVWVRGERGG